MYGLSGSWHLIFPSKMENTHLSPPGREAKLRCIEANCEDRCWRVATDCFSYSCIVHEAALEKAEATGPASCIQIAHKWYELVKGRRLK